MKMSLWFIMKTNRHHFLKTAHLHGVPDINVLQRTAIRQGAIFLRDTRVAASGSRGDIPPAKQTNVRGNNILTRPFRSFVPAGALALWEQERITETNGIFIVQPCIQDILQRLDDFSIEHSGIVGPEWVQIRSGTAFAAPVALHALFTWHFHPEGNESMSPEDWVVFLASSAVATALLTRHSARIFQKSAATRKISQSIHRCLQQNGSNPTLAMRRVFSLVQRTLSCDFERFSDDEIATKLYIRVFS